MLFPLITPPKAVGANAGSAVIATRVPFGTRLPFGLAILLNVRVVGTVPLANKVGGLTRTVAVVGNVPVPAAVAVVKLEPNKVFKGFPATSFIPVVS